MGNLVPQKRMNVNGHLVTKHVRAESPLKRKPFTIPPVSQFSQEFGTSLTSACAIAESIYSFDHNDQLLDVYGKEVHDYGYEEARDALIDLLPHTTLKNLADKLNGLPEGRLKILLAEQVHEDIAIAIRHKRDGEEITRLGKLGVHTVNDGIDLAQFADDFSAPDEDTDSIVNSMYSASRSVRRACFTDEWKALLPDEESYRHMVEAEFIVNILTEGSIERDEGKSVAELYAHRKEVLDNLTRIKKHQAHFRERAEINLGMLDELDKTSSAVREGVL
jgi:hypothetical protein